MIFLFLYSKVGHLLTNILNFLLSFNLNLENQKRFACRRKKDPVTLKFMRCLRITLTIFLYQNVLLAVANKKSCNFEIHEMLKNYMNNISRLERFACPSNLVTLKFMRCL